MKKKNYTFLLFPSVCHFLIILMVLTTTLNAFAVNMDETDQNLSKIHCSLQVRNQTLEHIFDTLEQQSVYSIVCVNQSGFLQKNVSLDAQNSNLEDVLQKLSAKAGFTYVVINHKIIVKPNPATTADETRIIKGLVTDSKKESLPGVSVMVKGTNTGTTTGQDGNFSIKANTGDILVLTYIGFLTKEVTVSGENFYNITLAEDAKGLSEVVVTALGIKKEKAKLGYAVQEVQGEALVKAREPNVINSLTGRVAGLNIQNSTDLFQDPQISLRGRKPLIVIDGIPDQSADLWKINADDIETMSVLKGASASALYGSIGQNGAIMITTKRGKGKDLSVEINSSTEFQPSFIRIPKVQTEYGDGFKGKYTYVDGTGGGPEGGGWIWGPKLDQRDPSTPSGYYETPQFNSPVDPKTGQLVPLPFISRGKDNVQDFFRTGVISSNNISITKSSDKGS
ncbi:MAG TPA: carboxypeptidase-like regulatory domain-containing protein, partial [Pedobacter sp.]